MSSLLNRKGVKEYLLSEAKNSGKKLTCVSASTLDWAQKELEHRLDWLVSVHAHNGPKTITPPR